LGVITTAFLGFLVSKANRLERKVDGVKVDVDTGNGKDIGTTVHDIAQTVEVMQSQLHTNTREVLNLHDRLNEHHEMLTEHLENARELSEEVLPVVAEMKQFLEENEQQHGAG
jgi:uncharacterized coiled-coil DUF342 family protein